MANLLTGLSLFCGFFSIIFLLGGYFSLSSYAILLSVILDGLDGQAARKNKISSDFGKEFDSLVDVVSFGIAPVLLGYTFIYSHFHILTAACLFVYLLFAVIRLVKYNIVQYTDENFFTGLPTTVSGGILASFILIYSGKEEVVLPKFIPIAFVVLVLLLAYLMVSRVRYFNLDGLKQLFGERLKAAILFLFIILSLALYWDKIGITLFCIFLIYLIFSPFVVKRLNSISPR
ncbi:MAG: CDP-diacylglycerol--serine O-phosphatidyltransferase [Candidatus Omnitrophota bacterium]